MSFQYDGTSVLRIVRTAALILSDLCMMQQIIHQVVHQWEHTTKWLWIVSHYTPCKLTYAKDILPALSGIAAVIHQQT